MQPIFATAPKTKIKVIVGSLDTFNRIAIFYITPARFFEAANAFGIDEKVFRQKAVNWCETFRFNFWDGRSYEISRLDFMKTCWLYPPKADPDYKANKEVFKPKLVISLEKAEKLKQKTKEKRDLEMLKIAMS